MTYINSYEEFKDKARGALELLLFYKSRGEVMDSAELINALRLSDWLARNALPEGLNADTFGIIIDPLTACQNIVKRHLTFEETKEVLEQWDEASK